jgi:hypothetical protein
MSTVQEAPALIQYACERCKTRFVLPPSRRRLGFGGRMKATGMALSRTLRFHEGLGSTYDGARRQLLAKMDDDAYQSFVQSFKFCHECRQFVCSECWSNSRKTCLGCFAKAAGTTVRQRPPFAPEGPPIPRPVAAAAPASRRRLRTDASLLVMGLAVLLLVVELLVILPGINRNGGNSPDATDIGAVGSPTDTPTAAPTDSATATPTVVPIATATPTASPSPSPSASPSPTASPSPSPSPTVAPTRAPTAAPPKPTAPPKPFPTSLQVSCAGGVGKVTCNWVNYDKRGSITWTFDGGAQTSKTRAPVFHVTATDNGPHTETLSVTYGGKTYTASGPYTYTS